MTYASVVFAHVSDPKLGLFQNIQNRFLRVANGCPWYLRNIDLHRDFDLPTIRKFMKDVRHVISTRVPTTRTRS
jgi:hypothetical protein